MLLNQQQRKLLNVPKQDIYKSKAWKNIRYAYALSHNCQCERCGRYVYVAGLTDNIPKDKRLKCIVHHKVYLTSSNYTDDSIAYDDNNLELLCIDCHNKEHFQQATKKDVKFDEMGNLVKIAPLYPGN